MWKFITDNFKEFWRGTVAGSFAGGGIVYFNKIIFLDYLGSLFTVGLSAVIGGMCTALAADIYKHRIQKKLFKNRKNGREKNKTDESEKVA